MVANKHNVYHGPNGATCSAYVTYVRPKDALAAIQYSDGSFMDGKMIRASFGTTKVKHRVV